MRTNKSLAKKKTRELLRLKSLLFQNYRQTSSNLEALVDCHQYISLIKPPCVHFSSMQVPVANQTNPRK